MELQSVLDQSEFEIWGWSNAPYTRDPERREKRASRALVDKVSTRIRDSFTYMNWSTEVGTGDSSGFEELSDQFEHLEIDHVAEDRLRLLSMKYATTNAELTREQSARLYMLDEQIELETPRYTERDWALLDEADELLKRFEQLQGD